MGSFELSLLPILLLTVVAAVSVDELRTFIVHVQPHKSHVFCTTEDDRTTWYKTSLAEDERLVHSYHRVASGFAARLTEQELDTLSAMPGFVTAVPNQVYRLLTTHTPQFLGLELPQSGRNYTSGSGEGVIIGVLDGGVDPFHPSFSGGMPSPLKEGWKGCCDFNA
jgi:subtilisin family serine protease